VTALVLVAAYAAWLTVSALIGAAVGVILARLDPDRDSPAGSPPPGRRGVADDIDWVWSR
jgi:hypothetical protein